jgi:hypothetical protein
MFHLSNTSATLLIIVCSSKEEMNGAYEGCSNETHSGVVLGEGVETIKNSPHGH